MKKSYGALVVGAGIGGIRSALDLAETGLKVALIDKRHGVGGILTQLDHQFPTDHCGMCKMLPLAERDSSSQFCMRKGLFHKNIDMLLSTELTELEGEPGGFTAVLTKHSPFVDPTKCIGCGLCSEVCPVRVKNEFNAGLTERAAVYMPIPHAIPNHYVVDLDNCQRCWQCHKACPTGAIDFKFEERKDFRILVADKDASTAQNLSEWFKDQHFPFEFVNTGADAVDSLSAGKEYGMLLLGMELPDMDPERLLARALELWPEMTVVLLATPETVGAAHDLLQEGAREYVLKPLEKSVTVPWLDKLYMRIMSEERIQLDVGAVILAGGFDCYDPSPVGDVLGYGKIPGVVTSLEFERMMSSTGPLGGDQGGLVNGTLLRPVDGRPVKKIAWLQCVGSRDIKKNADYCSSVCCMISIKEANLARRVTNGEAEATIFYMDMRVFGKGYQHYYDNALNKGMRFIPARIHSVVPDPDSDTGAIRVEYLGADGTLVTESFDLLVLAVGARPPANMDKLALAADIECNEWGFCKTRYLAPSKTSRYGVFAAGSFAGAKDITESIIQSGAAALEASRIINIYAPLKDQTPEPEPEYRDVSREPARTLVALCTSCPVLDKNIDMEAMRERLSLLPSVIEVVEVGRACMEDGWEEIVKLAQEKEPNRILIGACMPYAYVPKLRELGATLGLNPALMDVVDVYTTPAKAGEGEEETERVTKDVFSTLSMAAVRLMGADPSPLPPPQSVSRQALVVGGGLAGLTAALGIADHGYNVHVVEESEVLGGQSRKLRFLLQDEDPVRFMEDLVEQVLKHPNITIHKDARIALSMGKAGRFMSVVSTDEASIPVEHGVTILATGGHEAKVYEYGNRVHKTVMTQLELEEQLASGSLDTASLGSVAMIQCWRSREGERAYCSRVCCAGALKNLLYLKNKHPDLPVYVFYRDIMTYGFSESYYTKAREAGAIFIRYTLDTKPVVSFEDGKPVITALDPVLGREVEVHADLLGISSGIEPAEVGELEEMFGVEVDEDGFFKEAEPKWRPVDFLKQGVFMCGLARGPANMSETIASAKAAAQRAIRILSEKRLTCGNVVAEVRHDLCSQCGRCVDVCAYGARRMDWENDRIVVDELLCQGCGSCAAVCPNSASILRGYRDVQVMSAIDAALAEYVKD